MIYNENMNKTAKITLIVIGVMLFLNGVLNIIDDARVLTYDIASILSGLGFIIIASSKKK